MKKRIKSYHKTKVSRHEVMTGNSSSTMTNAPPVTMQRGIRLVNVKHAAETTQSFLALPPATAGLVTSPPLTPPPADPAVSSCRRRYGIVFQLRQRRRESRGQISCFSFSPSFPPNTVRVGVGVGAALPVVTPASATKGEGWGGVHQETPPVAMTTPSFLPPRWTLSAIFFCCAAKLYLATSASHACL